MHKPRQLSISDLVGADSVNGPTFFSKQIGQNSRNFGSYTDPPLLTVLAIIIAKKNFTRRLAGMGFIETN